MKVLLVLIMLVSALLSNDKVKYSDSIVSLTYEQKVILIKSYMLGADSGYGYTLAAIAWKESNFGLYKMNLVDGNCYDYKGSFGVYHILLNTAMSRNKHKNNWSASRVAEKLYSDIEYSSKHAITELLFWQRVWSKKQVKKEYSHIVASYNAGYKSINSEAGNKYAKDILLRVNAIKKYFKEYRINEIMEVR